MEYSYRRKWSYVNTAIVVLNVAFFFFLELHGSTERDTDMMIHYGAMFIPAVVEGKEYYRLFTSMFMHFGFAHLLNNMIILFVLGDNRLHSTDSRALGSFSDDDIVGKKGLVVFPFNNMKFID